jgi:IS6 family transposase
VASPFDEIYIRVKGQWKYLYRAIDKGGATLDFYLADRRNAKAAKRFLAKALRRVRRCCVGRRQG